MGYFENFEEESKELDNDNEFNKDFVKLATNLSTDLVDGFIMSDEDVRYDGYAELIDSVIGTMVISPGNYQRFLEEFVSMCREERISSNVVQVSLDSIRSKKELIDAIKSTLNIQNIDGINDVSEALSYGYGETFKPHIFVFTGSPKVSSSVDYLGDWIGELKLSSLDEKAFYVGTSLREVEYRSDYLGEKKPIILK